MLHHAPKMLGDARTMRILLTRCHPKLPRLLQGFHVILHGILWDFPADKTLSPTPLPLSPSPLRLLNRTESATEPETRGDVIGSRLTSTNGCENRGKRDFRRKFPSWMFPSPIAPNIASPIPASGHPRKASARGHFIPIGRWLIDSITCNLFPPSKPLPSNSNTDYIITIDFTDQSNMTGRWQHRRLPHKQSLTSLKCENSFFAHCGDPLNDEIIANGLNFASSSPPPLISIRPSAHPPIVDIYIIISLFECLHVSFISVCLSNSCADPHSF